MKTNVPNPSNPANVPNVGNPTNPGNVQTAPTDVGDDGGDAAVERRMQDPDASAEFKDWARDYLERQAQHKADAAAKWKEQAKRELSRTLRMAGVDRNQLAEAVEWLCPGLVMDEKGRPAYKSASGGAISLCDAATSLLDDLPRDLRPTGVSPADPHYTARRRIAELKEAIGDADSEISKHYRDRCPPSYLLTRKQNALNEIRRLEADVKKADIDAAAKREADRPRRVNVAVSRDIRARERQVSELQAEYLRLRGLGYAGQADITLAKIGKLKVEISKLRKQL